jgi:hypothetical protein
MNTLLVIQEKSSQSLDSFQTLRNEKNAVCLMSRRRK